MSLCWSLLCKTAPTCFSIQKHSLNLSRAASSLLLLSSHRMQMLYHKGSLMQAYGCRLPGLESHPKAMFVPHRKKPKGISCQEYVKKLRHKRPIFAVRGVVSYFQSWVCAILDFKPNLPTRLCAWQKPTAHPPMWDSNLPKACNDVWCDAMSLAQ